MYCPRCGSPNTETTKFCRQCGLPMSQVTDYVSTGGTAPIAQQPAPSSSSPALKLTEGLTPKQQLILTILLIVFSPAIFGVLGDVIGLHKIAGGLAGIAAVLTPIGIVWAVFHYKAQLRRLRQQAQQQMQTPTAQQMFQPPTYQPTLGPPPTNPLATPIRGSVTEDETQRLPESRR